MFKNIPHNQIVFLICLACLVLLNACGNLPEKGGRDALEHHQLAGIKSIKQLLYTQFNEWKATRYQIGGLTKKGIDCSGFVYVTFRSRFGISLPRTTKLQSALGARVAKNELKAGDLVFFKSGFSNRHVGIYVEKQKFMHASKSRGVMISSLDDEYWSKRYWKSVRI